MRQHIDALRSLCADNHANSAPYVVRTRFERELYGLLVSAAQMAFNCTPNNPTEQAVSTFLSCIPTPESSVARELLSSGAALFARFTYLCDTSNWSNDGQDPRVEACREEILN